MNLFLSLSVDDRAQHAVLRVNDNHYVLSPATIKSEADLKEMLKDHPPKVYRAVVALLEELAE